MIVAAFALALLAGMGLDATRGGTLSSRLKVGLVVPGALLSWPPCWRGSSVSAFSRSAPRAAGRDPSSAILGPASASLLLSAALGAAALACNSASRRGGPAGSERRRSHWW